MADWSPPSDVVTPLHVSWVSPFHSPAAMVLENIFGPGQPGSQNWVANLAVYIPFQLPYPYQVARLWWINGNTVTTTNVDMGIYTADGTRLYSTGSTTQTPASQPQYAAVSGHLVLDARTPYYLAWTCDNTTARSFSMNISTAAIGRGAGLLEQASALPLPATATFAAFTTQVFAPVCGVTRTTT